jgi:general nucleoside transport system permease protein
MLSDFLQLTVIVGLFSVMIRITTPILLASVGRLIPSLAGVVDLSPEGVMLIGALAGFVAADRSGSAWLGLLGGLVAGLLLSVLSGILIVVLKMDHAVSGIAVNMFAAGIAYYLYRILYEAGGEFPSVATFDRVHFAGLSDIPILGEILFSQHAITYLAYVLAILIGLFLFKTRFGLVLRFTGENPRTVDTKGINVGLVQFGALLSAGMMYGIAGAFLPLVSVGLFVPGITAGRGWIAVALVSFGRFKPLWIVLAALLFGFLEAFQLQITALGIDFPYQIMLALPYVATILVLVVGKGSAAAPQQLGVPFYRE